MAAWEQRELQRRNHEYRDGRPTPDVQGKTVIVVDDGLATGATMRAALVALRGEHPAKLIAAVPVAPAVPCQELGSLADEVVCVETPKPFSGVGRWYNDFSPTSDAEVRELLARNAEPTGTATGTATEPDHHPQTHLSRARLVPPGHVSENREIMTSGHHAELHR